MTLTFTDKRHSDTSSKKSYSDTEDEVLLDTAQVLYRVHRIFFLSYKSCTPSFTSYEQCLQFTVILKILADKEKADGRSLLKEEVSD